MVSIHGISRNAREQAEAFVTLAERHNLLLIAPLFGADRFTDYQRLGRAGKGPRADLALNRILREVTELSGVDSERFFLFGFSGGGQFAHRYAFAYPHRVAALVVGAAGWYTLPDPGRRYPHGTAAVAELPGIDFDPERYLRVPACVLVGEGDIQRDPELKRTGRLDREQGRNRVARGRSWIAAMRTAADRQGVQTRYHFDTLPGFGHSFLEGHRSERFCDCISRFLFAY
jgi:poly(3-hydroxybutyrate) depolymerase